METSLSANKVEYVLENLKDHAIFLLDGDGRICSWNPGSERLFGFNDSDTIGKSFATIFTPEDVKAGIPEKEMLTAKSEGKALVIKTNIRAGALEILKK